MKQKPINLKRCQAMIDAGIADPNSQRGIDFCTECPYPRCILFDTSKKPNLRSKQVKLMQARGMTNREIAKELGVSIRTVGGDIKRLVSQETTSDTTSND